MKKIIKYVIAVVAIVAVSFYNLEAFSSFERDIEISYSMDDVPKMQVIGETCMADWSGDGNKSDVDCNADLGEGWMGCKIVNNVLRVTHRVTCTYVGDDDFEELYYH
ncbi:MAG: hypothetical protein ACJASP_001756 [Roseivirga sp.]|jgi:hypothetical protein